VLVPEGRTDYDWLKLLVCAVDLKQGWAAADESRFGSYVGVVPTHDAAVEATAAVLSRLHPRVTALVDGDGPGVGYAQALAAAAARPAVILRWQDGWTLENVVGWILEADQAAAIAALAQSVAPSPATIAALVSRLKNEDRAAHGLKQDQIAYEAIADVIGSTDACCRRARELLNAMTDILLGGDHARFTIAAGESPHIRIFRP
jgi:DNA primase